MGPKEATHTGAESRTARRILAIDEEIAMLERVRPKVRFSATTLVPLLLLPGVVGVLLSSERDVNWPYLIQLVLIVAAVPGVLYGVMLFRNRRHRRRLEREMDELISDREVRDHPRGV